MNKDKLLEYKIISDAHKNNLLKRSAMVLFWLYLCIPISTHLLGIFTLMELLDIVVSIFLPIIVGLIIYMYLEIRKVENHLNDKYEDRSDVEDVLKNIEKRIRKNDDDLTRYSVQKRMEKVKKFTKNLVYQGMATIVLYSFILSIFMKDLFLPIELTLVLMAGAVFMIWDGFRDGHNLYDEGINYLKDLKWYISRQRDDKK